MLIRTVKTRPFLPPKDDLLPSIKESFSILKLQEKSIFVITSKIVSIWQGRCIKVNEILDKPRTFLSEKNNRKFYPAFLGKVRGKDELIKKEAEFYIDRDKVPNQYVMLTMKQNLLIPTAGIDESNGNGYFILWPKEPYKTAKKIYNFIKRNYHLKNFGIIISDSHCTPLRWGTIGIALSYYGFYPLKDYRGKKDIFGREMQMTQSNIADSLAAAAVCAMGEGSEQTPIAIIEDIDFVEFKAFDPTNSNPLEVDKDDDIYAPLLKAIKWKKGGSYQK